jgi:hypothetical protein
MQTILTCTLQQENGYESYKEYVKELESIDLPYLDFWDWYSEWCFEEGLFNDRASYQD